MIKRKRSWQHKVKPCNDYMDLRDDESLELGEKKRWNNWKREFIHHEQTPKEGIYHLDKTRIRIMLCLSFTNLNWWQATDCIQLILVGTTKRDIT